MASSSWASRSRRPCTGSLAPHAASSDPGKGVSQFLGRPLELLWAEDGAVDRSTDGGAASLVSTASLERLRREMATDLRVDGRRFRMLFEIDGIGPHEEDTWIGRHLQVGDGEVIVPATSAGAS
jgi:uncharacterized protein YcbX